MISLRLRKQKPNASGGDLELRNLIAEIGAFTPEQRAATARGLAMLWDACLGRFGGLDGCSKRILWIAQLTLKNSAPRLIG
jgi:hypothetical protein